MPQLRCPVTRPLATKAKRFSKSPPARVIHRQRRGVAFMLLTLIAMASGCEVQQPQADPSADAPELESTINVATLRVDLSQWPTTARSQGSLVADEQTVVSTKVAGRVSQVNVDIGDYAEKNRPIVLLDTTQFDLEANQAKARLEQARAAVGLEPNEPTSGLSPMNAPPVRQEKAIWEEAKNSLQRAQNLLEQGAISKGEFDIAFASERAAEARHDAALNSVQEKIAMINTRETELALAKHHIAEATILAPLSGYIQSRLVAPGTYLAVGQPVATMVATDPLRYRGTLPERYAQRLKPGLSITLNLASLPNPITASITRVSPTLEDQSRVISFEADIANPDQAIRAGLFAEAEVVIAPEATAIAVPASAVDSFAGVQKVWKVVEDHAVEQEVLIGMKRNDRFEITSGLELGDEIIIDASKGKRAKVIRTETPNKNQLTPSNESNN